MLLLLIATWLIGSDCMWGTRSHCAITCMKSIFQAIGITLDSNGVTPTNLGTFLDRDHITQVVLPFIGWSEERGELQTIGSIKLKMCIDALAIFETFNDRNALIRLKCDNPEAQKRLWLNHLYRAPHHSFKP